MTTATGGPGLGAWAWACCTTLSRYGSRAVGGDAAAVVLLSRTGLACSRPSDQTRGRGKRGVAQPPRRCAPLNAAPATSTATPRPRLQQPFACLCRCGRRHKWTWSRRWRCCSRRLCRGRRTCGCVPPLAFQQHRPPAGRRLLLREAMRLLLRLHQHGKHRPPLPCSPTQPPPPALALFTHPSSRCDAKWLQALPIQQADSTSVQSLVSQAVTSWQLPGHAGWAVVR